MRNFDFKRYTPRPKKLFQASLKEYCSLSMFQMQHHSDKLDLTTHLCFVVDIGCIQHVVQ